MLEESHMTSLITSQEMRALELNAVYFGPACFPTSNVDIAVATPPVASRVNTSPEILAEIYVLTDRAWSA